MIDEGGFLNWLVYSKGLKQSSINTVRRRLAYFNGFLRQNTLNNIVCEDFIVYLREKNRRNATVNGYVLLFIYLSEYLHLELTKNIKFFPKQYRVPTILNIDEIKLIIDSPCALDISYQFPDRRRVYLNKLTRIFTFFLACTGCRFSEASKLRKSCLQLGIDSGYALFRDTKTDIDRRVPLPPKLVNELIEWTKEKKPSDLVFTSSAGNELVEQTFNPWLRKKVENAGVHKYVHCHTFRSSYIMQMLKDSRVDVITLARIMGHTVETCMGYTKFDYEDIEKAAEKHPLFSESVTPKKILSHLVEMIEKHPIIEDDRFIIREEKRDNSLLFEIYIK